MNPTIKLRGPRRSSSFPGTAAALALAAVLSLPALAQAQAAYDKPELAADAVVNALATADDVAMAVVLGKGWRQLMGLEDATVENRYTFLAKASQARVITVQDGRAHLTVGSDPWVLPVPIEIGRASCRERV